MIFPDRLAESGPDSLRLSPCMGFLSISKDSATHLPKKGGKGTLQRGGKLLVWE